MRKKWVVCAAVVIVILTTVGIVAWHKMSGGSSVLREQSQLSTFPLYEPTYLPEGYSLDESSISLTSQAMLMTAQNTKGDVIIFTENPTPKGYDYDSFYESRYSGIQDAPSIYGRGKAGIIDGAMSGSLVTDSTWILIKGSENLPAKDMKQIINSLKPLL